MSGLVLGGEALTSMPVAVLDVLFSLLSLQAAFFITKAKNKEISAKWSISLGLRLMTAYWGSCAHSHWFTGRTPIFPTFWPTVSLFPHPAAPALCRLPRSRGLHWPWLHSSHSSTCLGPARILEAWNSHSLRLLVPVVWGLFQQDLHLSPGQRPLLDPWLVGLNNPPLLPLSPGGASNCEQGSEPKSI